MPRYNGKYNRLQVAQILAAAMTAESIGFYSASDFKQAFHRYPTGPYVVTDACYTLLIKHKNPSELERIIDMLFREASLTDIEKKVLKLRWGLRDGEELDLPRVAKLLKIYPSRIHKIETRAFKKISQLTLNGL